MRINASLIATLLAIVLLTGCGGGGEPGPNGAATAGGKRTDPSGGSAKAAYIEKGDKICSQVPDHYHHRLEALEKTTNRAKPTKPEETLKAAVPPLYEAADDLEHLTPPRGDEQTAAAIVAALRNAAQGLEAKPRSELSGPRSPFVEFAKLTKSYGFQFCSSL